MLFNFTFEGNLAADPEMRITPTGRTMCRMRVGHNTRRRTSNGDWQNGPTMWITVTAWEALAERVAKHLRRGDTVVVEARDDLSAWAYLDQDDQKPAAQLQVTAANVALSLRFRAATAQSPDKSVEITDPWDESAESAVRELEPAA